MSRDIREPGQRSIRNNHGARPMERTPPAEMVDRPGVRARCLLREWEQTTARLSDLPETLSNEKKHRRMIENAYAPRPFADGSRKAALQSAPSTFPIPAAHFY